jgi:cytochrome P450
MAVSREKVAAPSKQFASPPGEPFFGHLRYTTVNPLPYYLQLREQYGDYIRFSTFPAPMTFHWYHMTHPAAAERILQTNQKNYSKGEFFLRSVRLLAGENLFSAEGDAWMRRRRLYQPMLHRNVINNFGPLIAECVGELLTRWERDKPQTVDLHRELIGVTLTTVAKALFSSDLSDEIESFTTAVREVLKLVNYKMNTPFSQPLWFPSERNRNYKSAHAQMVSTVKRMVAERRKRGAGSQDLLDILLSARDEETGLGFTDDDVVNEAIILLVAGHDTVAAAISWTFYLLSQNPDEDKKFFDEVSAALTGAPPDVSSLEKLPYTRMIFEESMRLYPPAWGQPRQAIEADEIDGYHLPKGAVISISQWVTHRHPEFWEQPEKFRPLRFEPAAAAGRPKYAYFPFGGGSRVCIGQHFGMLEGMLVLSSLGQKYRFELLPHSVVEPDATFTLIPKNGLPMRLIKR